MLPGPLLESGAGWGGLASGSSGLGEFLGADDGLNGGGLGEVDAAEESGGVGVADDLSVFHDGLGLGGLCPFLLNVRVWLVGVGLVFRLLSRLGESVGGYRALMFRLGLLSGADGLGGEELLEFGALCGEHLLDGGEDGGGVGAAFGGKEVFFNGLDGFVELAFRELEVSADELAVDDDLAGKGVNAGCAVADLGRAPLLGWLGPGGEVLGRLGHGAVGSEDGGCDVVEVGWFDGGCVHVQFFLSLPMSPISDMVMDFPVSL